MNTRDHCISFLIFPVIGDMPIRTSVVSFGAFASLLLLLLLLLLPRSTKERKPAQLVSAADYPRVFVFVMQHWLSAKEGLRRLSLVRGERGEGGRRRGLRDEL